jgi:hypothetical protein
MAWDSLIREISRSIDPSCIACWLRFTAEPILAETSDWLASARIWLALYTDEIDLRRLDASADLVGVPIRLNLSEGVQANHCLLLARGS